MSDGIRESISEVENLEKAVIDSYKAHYKRSSKSEDNGKTKTLFKGLNERRNRQHKSNSNDDSEMPPRKKIAKETADENEAKPLDENDIDHVDNTVESAISSSPSNKRRRRRPTVTTEFEEKERIKNRKMFGIICGTLAAFQREEEERKKSEAIKTEEEEGDDEGNKSDDDGEEGESSDDDTMETEEEREERVKEEEEKEQKAIKARCELNRKLAERFNSTKTTPKLFWATAELLSKLSK